MKMQTNGCNRKSSGNKPDTDNLSPIEMSGFLCVALYSILPAAQDALKPIQLTSPCSLSARHLLF